MDDAGLGPAPSKLEKLTKTNPSGKFGDPFGEDQPPETLTKSVKFRVGDRVVTKSAPNTVGTVLGVGSDCCAVEWAQGNRGLHRFTNLIHHE